MFDVFLRQLYTLTELQRLYDELVASADTCQLDRDAAEKPVRYRFISSGIYLASCWYVSSNLEAFSFLFLLTVQASEFNSTFFFCRSGWLWSRLLYHPSHSPVKGLYLYGGVGTGKTMLMDLFFNQLWVWHVFLLCFSLFPLLSYLSLNCCICFQVSI